MVIPLNVTLPRTEPHTSAAAWAFPLSPGAITASRWAPAGKTILGAELGNLAVFNREQGGAAPQFLPWDALLTFPALTTSWQGHLGEG